MPMPVHVGQRVITRLKRGGLYGKTIARVIHFTEGQVYYRMRKYNLTVSRKHARGESESARRLIARCTLLVQEARRLRKDIRKAVSL
jgi:hypothetical protein